MSSSISAGLKRPAAAMSSNNLFDSVSKRSKSSQEVMIPGSGSDSGSDTPSLTRSYVSLALKICFSRKHENFDLANFKREESKDAGFIAFLIADSPFLRSETPAALATKGQILRKRMLEGLHNLQEQKERIDGLFAKILEYVAPPLLAIEPFALHEHWVLNRRSTYDIVTDMLVGDADMSDAPYLTTGEILEREACYQETEEEMAAKPEQWRLESEDEKKRRCTMPP